MGISCRPWGPIKSDFDKLSYQMKKEAELAKKLGKKNTTPVSSNKAPQK